jgi:hypothetical protein
VLKEFSARHSEGTDEIKIIWMFRRLPPSALCISPLLGDETVGILKDALIRDVSVFREAHENGIFLVPIDFRYEREIEEFSRFLESMPQQTENARNELRTE